jgi:hypothetical protein
MLTFYLTNRADSSGPILHLLAPFYLNNDTPDTSLADAGWRYARFQNTGARILVRCKGNRRYLKAWGAYVTDFEARYVDTVAGSDGTIYAAKGEPHGLKLYALADRVAEREGYPLSPLSQ